METTKAPATAAERYIESIELMHEYPNHDSTKEILFNQLSSKKADIITLKKPQDWKKEFRTNEKFLKLLTERNVDTLYVPLASLFNGILRESYDFTKECRIGGVNIMNGCNAEGLVIPSKSAALICTADCPTIIYHDISNDILIAAHAGLGSVVDLQRITTGTASRPHEGIVDQIMQCTLATDDYEIFIICGINYKSFIYDPTDPIYGEKNKLILNYLLKNYGKNTVPLMMNHGGISIEAIIKKQFFNYGIEMDKIHCDGIDPFRNYEYWSHSRAFKGEEDDRGGRNGILVIHK